MYQSKKYYFTLTHDKGKKKISITATSQEAAIWMIMANENCPKSAIVPRYPSIAAFNDIVCKVDCKFGAPMGRINHGVKQEGKKVFDRAVPFIDGAYDKGGAYWGLPANLRVRYHGDLSWWEFYRK